MSPLSKEWQYPAIMGAVITFFLLMFYLDYSRTIDIGSREVVGYITYKNNRVQRKFEDQVVWSNLENNSPLTNRDTIRSETLSDAVIHLNDGTIIKIDENSMFFLDLSGASPKLSFHTGSIQVQQGADGKNELVIRSGERTISVSSGSDLKLEGNDPDQLNLIMQSGSARISGEGASHAVAADQQARFGPGGVTVRELSLKLLEPANQSVLAIEQSGAAATDSTAARRVAFRWQMRGEFKSLTFELSPDRNFARIITRSPANANGTIAALSAGSYYWRVRGENRATGQVETSEIRKIAVVRNDAVRLYTPARGENIAYVARAPLVNFTWSSNELANRYDLEIAGDAAFRTGAQRYSVRANSYSVRDLAAGTYFWRVRSQSSLAGVPERVSATGNFRIVQRDAFDVPRPGAPVSGAHIALAEATRGVTFAWQAPAELGSYRLQVSRDPAFRQLVMDRESPRSFLAGPLGEEGTYYWRVKGLSDGDKDTEYSAPVRFVVGDAPQLAATTVARLPEKQTSTATAQAAMRPLAPVNGAVNVSNSRSISFRWDGSAGTRRYHFRLYRGVGADRKLVLEQSLNRPGYVLSDFSKLDIGPFTWVVRATPGDEEIEARFTIISDNRLDELRPEDIEFVTPDTIYRE